MFFAKNALRDYEAAILVKVAENLQQAAKAIFYDQMKGVNKIQRHSNDMEVNLYRMTSGKPVCLSELQFVNHDDELLLATVSLTSGNASEQQIAAKVWIVRGILFSISFNNCPKSLASKFEIMSCRIHCDPMASSFSTPTEFIENSELASATCGMIRNILRITGKIALIYKPVNTDRFISGLENGLPRDYVDLLHITDGFTVDGWKFLGTHARAVTLSGRDAIVLADDFTQSAIVSFMNDDLHLVYLYNYEDDVLSFIGKNFADALRSVITNHEH